MEILRGIKPQAISLLPAPAGASIAINISLNPPVFAPNVPQELKVNLIMVLLEHLGVRHL